MAGFGSIATKGQAGMGEQGTQRITIKVGSGGRFDPPREPLTDAELAYLIDYQDYLRDPSRYGVTGGASMARGNSYERDAAALRSLDHLKFAGER